MTTQLQEKEQEALKEFTQESQNAILEALKAFIECMREVRNLEMPRSPQDSILESKTIDCVRKVINPRIRNSKDNCLLKGIGRLEGGRLEMIEGINQRFLEMHKMKKSKFPLLMGPMKRLDPKFGFTILSDTLCFIPRMTKLT
eukprot:Gb_37893 [translate_table: standard]